MAGLPFPPILLILDFIGTVLVAIGVAEWVIQPGMVIPQALQFPFYPQVLIALGVALILPMIFHLIARTSQR